MRRDLEDWLKGDAIHPAPERPPEAGNFPVISLRYLPAGSLSLSFLRPSQAKTPPENVSAEPSPEISPPSPDAFYGRLPIVSAALSFEDAMKFEDFIQAEATDGREENKTEEEEIDGEDVLSAAEAARSEGESSLELKAPGELTVPNLEISSENERNSDEDGKREVENETLSEEDRDDNENGNHDGKYGKNEDAFDPESSVKMHGPAGWREAAFPWRKTLRFADDLRQAVRRVSTRTGRRIGFRGNRGPVLTLCVVVVLIAVTGFAAVRHMRRNSYATLTAQAEQYYEEEQYRAALDVYSRTSERYPDRIEPLLGVARAAERLGELELAIDACHAGLEVLPYDAVAFRALLLCERGRLYTLLNDWESARQNFEAAASLDATNFNAWFSLGAALEEGLRPGDALTAYRRALDLSPSSDAARDAIERITALLTSPEEELAARQAQKYAEAVQVGNVALKLKRYDEASQRFAEALAIRSDDIGSWLGFADAREGLGDLGGAVRSCERVLERDPDNPDAQARLLILREKAAEAGKKRPSRSGAGRSPR